MQDRKRALEAVEDDDYFEEFAEENWNINQSNEEIYGMIWDDKWDDNSINAEVQNNIIAEINKFKEKITTNNSNK